MDEALCLLSPQTGEVWTLWPLAEFLPAGTVQEQREYFFELRNTTAALTANLFIDGLALEALRPPDMTTARWRWSPGFYAGSVELRLERPGFRPQTVEIVTDPDLRKLTRDEFDRMVRDILEDTLALFAISSFRTGVAVTETRRPPPIARLEYLLSRLPAIERAVQEISRTPQRRLQRVEDIRPWHQARTATGKEILNSLHGGMLLHETVHPGRLPRELKGHLPARIRQGRRTDTYDIPEHRDIQAALQSWIGWLNVMANRLELSRADDNSQQRLQDVWAQRVRQASRRLAVLLNLPVFREVFAGTGRLTVTATFRRVPRYMAFLRLYREFNLGLSAITGTFLNLPLAQTFRLYELWCFLRLLRAAYDLQLLPPGSTDGLFEDVSKASGILLVAEAVRIPLVSGGQLAFQLNFKEYWNERTWLNDVAVQGTYSRHMRPDVVLSGSAGLVVLDSKYRINQALGEALASIHMYRDAIVLAQKHGEGETIQEAVHAAYLLSPHVPLLRGQWQTEALPGRLFHQGYRRHFRFGALSMRPGMTMSEVTDTLRFIMQDAERHDEKNVDDGRTYP